ncbi:alpha/beta hydrolase [Diaminobutyricibacter sp. McL0618]|uniref:alpha/beta hydrolase n=1 Tax=Leifsonia sp. McL0618 TaxID=3415677 RepID=UPI003CEEC264
MSISMSLTRVALRARPNRYRTEATMYESARNDSGDAPIPGSLRRSCIIRRESVLGNTVITLTPKAGATGTHLIYAHGGVYVHSLVSAHWRIIATLIRLSGVTVTVPLYGLAPDHSADDAYPFLQAVYMSVVDRAAGKPVILAGDSCGGALSVGQAIRCRHEDLPAPAALILFSPWVDASMSNPGIAAIEKRDSMLAPAGLAAAGRVWAGSRSVADPLISPIHDTLRLMPPIFIYQGGNDILLPDAKMFAAKAKEAGNRGALRIYPAGVHVFVGAGWTPEARNALRDAAQHIRAATT